MRMGGHFLRLVLAVDKLVELLEVVPEHPPPEAAAEAEELAHYITSAYSQKHSSDGDGASSDVAIFSVTSRAAYQSQ